jgi:hypothetical protein
VVIQRNCINKSSLENKEKIPNYKTCWLMT